MKKRRKFIAGNWKMNPQSLDEAKDIFKRTKKAALKLKTIDTVVCPPFLYVGEIAKLAKNDIGVGVQNISTEESGSHTGEISAGMVSSIGARYSIIGHSERRAMGEDNDMISRKITAAFGAGLRPIVCVGEHERDPEGAYLEFLSDQIRGSLASVSKRDFHKVILAYEPIWAIGKKDSEAMTGRELYETLLYIRKVLTGMYGKESAFATLVLYGGSATFRNAGEIMRDGQVDGLLLGRQSLEPEGFEQLLKIVDAI